MEKIKLNIFIFNDINGRLCAEYWVLWEVSWTQLTIIPIFFLWQKAFNMLNFPKFIDSQFTLLFFKIILMKRNGLSYLIISRLLIACESYVYMYLPLTAFLSFQYI